MNPGNRGRKVTLERAGGGVGVRPVMWRPIDCPKKLDRGRDEPLQSISSGAALLTPAWNPMHRGAEWATVHTGSQRVGHS